jgi:hypothetical protein
MMKLSLLSVLLGLGMAAPQVYGLVKPVGFATTVRKFPRSVPAGYFLMALGMLWFLLNVKQESLADFAAYKSYMMLGFAAVGIGSCIFVQDFLVRGLAVVLLLLGKLMVDTTIRVNALGVGNPTGRMFWWWRECGSRFRRGGCGIC